MISQLSWESWFGTSESSLTPPSSLLSHQSLQPVGSTSVISPHFFCIIFATLFLHLYYFKNFLLWLVWLSGLSAGLQTKASPVRFPVRAHAWVVGQVPSYGHVRGNYTVMFLFLSSSFPLSLKINK